MNSAYTPPMQALIDALGRLPGVGPKGAQRIAFHLLKSDSVDVERLAHSITEAKALVRFCDRCFNFSDGPICRICDDDRRDSSMLCVVEESRDDGCFTRKQILVNERCTYKVKGLFLITPRLNCFALELNL